MVLSKDDKRKTKKHPKEEMKMMKSMVQELKELLKAKEELEAQINAVQDAIKAEMAMNDTDEIKGEGYTITWKFVTSHRVDVTAFKKAMPELAKEYTVESTYRRFCLK